MTDRILIVDDDPEMVTLLARGLERRGYHTVAASSVDDALACLDQDDVTVVITDLNLGGRSGLDLTQRLVANRPGLPVIVLTGFGNLDAAIGAIRAGAFDFLAKPVDLDVVNVALERAVRHRHLTDELGRLRRQVATTTRDPELIGHSAAMQPVHDLIARVAPTDASVLITGESGTGKELVARALHRQSRRADGPLVAINCAAVPDNLLESELFGHVKGAFTDARGARAGLFVQAGGGTLFLDEIGEMSMALQAKLLRVLQERMVRPLGGDHEVAVDVRIVTATNRDLERAIEAQRFDKSVTGLTPAAAERLVAYDWPGNVRELGNAIERAVALTRFDAITVDDLPERIRAYTPAALVVAATDPSELTSLEEVERRYILHVLAATGGSRTQASAILGLDRKTLYRRLKAYGVSDD